MCPAQANQRLTPSPSLGMNGRGVPRGKIIQNTSRSPKTHTSHTSTSSRHIQVDLFFLHSIPARARKALTYMFAQLTIRDLSSKDTRVHDQQIPIIRLWHRNCSCDFKSFSSINHFSLGLTLFCKQEEVSCLHLFVKYAIINDNGLHEAGKLFYCLRRWLMFFLSFLVRIVFNTQILKRCIMNTMLH